MTAEQETGSLDKVAQEQLIIEMAVKRTPINAIATHVALTRQQVRVIIKKYREEFRGALKKNYDAFLAEELERLEFIEHEFWNVYQRSKADALAESQESDKAGDGKLTKSRKSQTGDINALNGVLGVVKERSRLLNLYPTKKVDIDIRQLMSKPVAEISTGDLEYIRSHLQDKASDAEMADALIE